MLIVSTPADLSLDLFEEKSAATLITPSFITYDEVLSSGIKDLRDEYNYVYFRDPYNNGPIGYERIQQAIKIVGERFNSAYFVDNLSSYNGLLFEDKWVQYKQLSEYMPQTKLLRSLDLPDNNSYFIKKRISSRSKGIIFTKNDFPEDAKPDDYISQQLLHIEMEYRVFMVGDNIVKPIAIKTSKTQDQRVKVIGIENKLHPELVKICDATYKATTYNLMGLDIAKVGNSFYLLEVNRSCQFKGYMRKSSINLACILNRYLLTKS
jgi:hypothetical protein